MLKAEGRPLWLNVNVLVPVLSDPELILKDTASVSVLLCRVWLVKRLKSVTAQDRVALLPASPSLMERVAVRPEVAPPLALP